MKLFKTALFTTLLGAGALASTNVLAADINSPTTATTANSQQMQSTAPDSDQHAAKTGGQHKKMPPLVRLSKKLNLSQQQDEQIKTLVKNARPKIAELGQSLANNSQQIRLAMHDTDYDANKISELAKVQGDTISQMIVLRANLQHEVLAVLTPEQKTELKQLIQQKMSDD